MNKPSNRLALAVLFGLLAYWAKYN